MIGHYTPLADSSSPAALYDGGISAVPAGGSRGSAVIQAGGPRALVLHPDVSRGGTGCGSGPASR